MKHSVQANECTCCKYALIQVIQVIIAYVTSLLVLTSKNTAVLFYQLVNRTIEAHYAVQSERQVIIDRYDTSTFHRYW